MTTFKFTYVLLLVNLLLIPTSSRAGDLIDTWFSDALLGGSSNVRRMERFMDRRLVDANEKNIHGQTALHIAAAFGNYEVINVVTNYGRGVDVNEKDNYGNTALHIAAANGKVQVVQSLLWERNIYTELKDSNGNTALHIAAANGYTAVVVKLLEEGAKVNARDLLEATPLHHAAEKNHAAVVGMLLKAGADPEAEDMSGQTPRDLTEDQKVIRLLDRATGKDTP